MTTSAPSAAAQPRHPLDYWLTPERARLSPYAHTRLRQLADAQGALAAAWSSAIGGGPFAILASGFISVMTGNPAVTLVLGPMGAVLFVLGVLFWRRARATLPNTDRILITRGPGSAGGGIAMVSVLATIMGGIWATNLPEMASRGVAALVGWIGTYLLFVILMVVCILIPSVVMGRARQSFRQRIQANPALRTAVENDLLTWRDPIGNASYGPL